MTLPAAFKSYGRAFIDGTAAGCIPLYIPVIYFTRSISYRFTPPFQSFYPADFSGHNESMHSMLAAEISMSSSNQTFLPGLGHKQLMESRGQGRRPPLLQAR